MIKRIELKNFLSHRDTIVEFNGQAISIIGDNGSGKSALLEALPYAYYGFGRDTISNMSRLGGDGSHEVRIFDGINEIVRGCNQKGKGYSEIYTNGVLVAKGNEVSEWVSKNLGLDLDLYLLTVFYGLHDVRNDILLRVSPASRLEMVQKIAGIEFYKRLFDQVKNRFDDVSKNIEQRKYGIQMLSTVTFDLVSIRLGLSKKKVLLDEYSSQLEEISKNIVILKNKEDAFRTLTQNLRIKEESLRKTKDDFNSVLDDLTNLVDEEKTVHQEISSINDRISQMDSVSEDKLKEYTNLFTELNRELSELDVKISLKSKGVELGSTTQCPLCHSLLSEDVQEKWKIELESFLEQKKILIARIAKGKEKIEQLQRSLQVKQRLLSEKEICLTRIKGFDQQKVLLGSKKEKLESEIKRLEQEVSFLEKEISSYESVVEEIKKLDSERLKYTDLTGKLTGEIKQLETQLKKALESEKQMEDLKREVEKLTTESQALDILKSAWNRYGIPLELMKSILSEIQYRSTNFFSEFGGGAIKIIETTDRNRPGIDFQLSDKKGDRSFGQLSTGEKVMFFVSIRVAISQIIEEISGVRMDYLVLDEIFGNLSPDRRDDLMRIVNKVLRKVFPQMIVVSHTEMRDIFDQVFRVSSDKGYSIVESIV